MEHMRYLASLLAACAACMAQTPSPVSVPESIALEANIAYDRFPDTRLDMMYPKAPSPTLRPGVIMFHGGGWIRSTKETMMQAFCLPFLEQGFVVANVEYRVATAALAPAAVNDALTAAKWFLVMRSVITSIPAACGHRRLRGGISP
jgi:acetyl esterase/lipase